MPWELTTPISTGGVDPSVAEYTECKLIRMLHDAQRLMIFCEFEYGNTNGGVWEPGLNPTNLDTSYPIEGTEYTTLVTTAMPQQGETTYEAVKRGLYEHLASVGVIPPGSVV